ncbi:MAG TPA: diaminopimelate epimerase [Ignavibacteria bacterium]|jgi:diaminopimelate epimerase
MKYEIYSGAGNDFVMINNLSGKIPQSRQANLAERICEEQFKNIDGVIFLDKPQNINAVIRMNYYNRDGSFGAMCGNGARCIAQYAVDNGIINEKTFKIEAVDKLYLAEIIKGNLVKITFPSVSDYKLDVHMELGKELAISKLHWMDVGSEHIVVFIDDIINPKLAMDDIPISKWGSLLRFHESFQPKGANVNFTVKSDENELRLRTYERGVERETLACGTGIISSAIIAGLLGYVKSPVSVIVQSGEKLKVEYNINRSVIENISLEGSARKIGEGEFAPG